MSYMDNGKGSDPDVSVGAGSGNDADVSMGAGGVTDIEAGNGAIRGIDIDVSKGVDGGIDIERIPRTLRLVRADESMAPIPVGFPVLMLLDQTRLPYEEEYLCITDWRRAMDAIRDLEVRGAPAIGVTGAAIMALRAAEYLHGHDDRPVDELDFDRAFVLDDDSTAMELFGVGLGYAAEMVRKVRPTAVSLGHALDACMEIVDVAIASGDSMQAIAERLFEFASAMIDEDEERNRRIGAIGASLLPDGATLLTHCNAGSLATAFYGTALGVVYSAAEQGKVERVFADETRPVGQGSRLTAFELSRAGVPVTLICDGMAASVMASGDVDAVVVGADRIAANGDVANKIGTLGVAISARRYGIPFYVAAPTDTIDPSSPDGSSIAIEERDPAEVLPTPIDGVDVYNPAFDVTPAELVSAIVTERGSFPPDEIMKALS